MLVRGSIDLTAVGDFRYHHRRGDLIGAAAAFCHALPGYAARATSDALVLRIAEQDFYDQAEEHPHLTRGTLKYLVSELEPLLEIDDSPNRVPFRGPVSPGA